MDKGVISNLLNNKILTLSLSEQDHIIFKTYLSALKLNSSLLVLYLQDIGFKNIQSLLNILIHNRSLQKIYFSKCNFDCLILILNYFKINYYINIHLSLCASFNLSNIEKLSELLLYNNKSNIIELYCIINDEDCMLYNDKIDVSNMEIIDNSINFISNYKLLLILYYIKPLINAIKLNKLLFIHLNFLMLYYNSNLIPLLIKTIQHKYNLTDNVMKRIDITNELKFYEPISSIIKK